MSNDYEMHCQSQSYCSVRTTSVTVTIIRLEMEEITSKSRLVAELDQLTSLSVDELAEVYDSECR